MRQHYAAVTVGDDDLYYPYCSACYWEGTGTDQYEAARLEADAHSDPEVLREMEEWEKSFSVDPFTQR